MNREFKKMLLSVSFLICVICIGIWLKSLDIPRVGVIGYLEQLYSK